jgi:hypothetical protein
MILFAGGGRFRSQRISAGPWFFQIAGNGSWFEGAVAVGLSRFVKAKSGNALQNPGA